MQHICIHYLDDVLMHWHWLLQTAKTMLTPRTIVRT